ncbi:MAG: hypothetical protein HQL73_03415 [Magnetococcales bacterium]|nr:hypothetical protein [Magnetococcales bacterium]
MHRAFYHLELLENLICQSSNASVGLPPGLDCIPGNMFLGAAAKKLYDGLKEKAFAVFHSGQVRFGDGLPLAPDGQPALPMPLCLYEKKYSGNSLDHSDRLNGAAIRNAWADASDLDQYKQLRHGFLTLAGHWLRPRQSVTMKTAIDPETGRAFTGRLFGYHGLTAGQSFWSGLEADESIDPELFEQVAKSLEGRLRLGNSRNAEFGSIQATRMKGLTKGLFSHGEVLGKTRLTLWLLGDLLALDPHGMPTLTPLPQWLGLPIGQIRTEKCFLRHHVYAPFNGKRRHQDPERSCIKAGSILHFELDLPMEVSHQHLLDRGLGVHREAGLGRVLANPPLLLPSSLDFQKTSPLLTVPTTRERPETGTHPLVGWLRNRVHGRETRDRNGHLAETMRPWLVSLYTNARRLNALPDTIPVGPGASQWSAVMSLARTARDDVALMARLFGTPDKTKCRDSSGLCSERAGGQGWMDETALAGRITTFRECFQKICQKHADHGCRGFVVELARRAMDVAKEQNR